MKQPGPCVHGTGAGRLEAQSVFEVHRLRLVSRSWAEAIVEDNRAGQDARHEEHAEQMLLLRAYYQSKHWRVRTHKASAIPLTNAA